MSKLPVSPDEELAFAASILGDSEVSARAAASRAYYAAFHCLFPLGQSLPEPPKEANVRGSHSELIYKLSRCPPRGTGKVHLKYRGFGARLAQMRASRVLADYQLVDRFTVNAAAAMIEDARSLIIDFTRTESESSIGGEGPVTG